ncbi:MAG: glycosyltransferase family 4 protein [Gemmatimonadales bacterium]|nr:MAG: glycosyltransferase family 4 protein [Gemmatimonadales bacterium]
MLTLTLKRRVRMRVLILAPPSTETGRITRFSFIDEELQGLSNAGVEVFVLTSSVEVETRIGPVTLLPIPRDHIWNRRVRSLGLIARHRHLIPGTCLRDVSNCIHRVRVEDAIREAVQKHHIDVIHSHFGPFLGFGGLLARAETGVPLVSTFRGMDLLMDEAMGYGLRRTEFYSAALRAQAGAADVTTYASDFMRDAGLRVGADPATAITIRKGVDLDHFDLAPDREELRAELGVDGPMILTVAGLIRRKGVDTILRALGRLRDSHDFTLVICGKGPETPALRKLGEELGLTDRLDFRGRVPRDQIQRYFAACDVFILASRMEAAGNVLLEAMGAGRPVIATDSGGPGEYVRNDRTGFVIPVDDDAAMADRLAHLLDNPEVQERLGSAGREIAHAEHGYDVVVKGFISAYERARASGSRPLADAR